ncbi:MAG: FtsQ-type POTRA domain-containing protein [Alphaproteobacteria bacterium]
MAFFRWWQAHADVASKIGFVSCVVTYVLISAFGLSHTGQWRSVWQSISTAANDLAVAAGLEVKTVTVDGKVNLTKAEVTAALGTRRGVSILAFDTAAARKRLKNIPWVREARVTRFLPSTLFVELEEKRPFALWRDEKHTVAIDAEGKILAEVKAEKFRGLPVVSGAWAARPARYIIARLRKFPKLYRRVASIERIAKRRWDIIFDTGMRAKLPAVKISQALMDLDAMANSKKATLYEIAEIDFRVPTQFTVRLRDNSESARKKFITGLAKAKEARSNEM